jgi:hypothetical protein
MAGTRARGSSFWVMVEISFRPGRAGPALEEAEVTTQDITEDQEQPTLIGSTNDLADDTPRSRLDRILQWIPRLLSSKLHVMLLMLLGVYLIILPLAGLRVGANAELIGGNYTNVTSDIGACIAAGGTLHLIQQGRRRRKVEEERLRLAQQTHRLLHHVYGDAAVQLGHVTRRVPPDRDPDTYSE